MNKIVVCSPSFLPPRFLLGIPCLKEDLGMRRQTAFLRRAGYRVSVMITLSAFANPWELGSCHVGGNIRLSND